MAKIVSLADPIGKVVGIIPDMCAALVEVTLSVTEITGGGSSTATTTEYEETRVIPAKVLTRGSKGVKDYFNYEVGDMVCLLKGSENFSVDEREIFRAEGAQYSNFYMLLCYIAGSVYTLQNRPPAYFEGVRLIDFGGGNYIEVNLEEKTLDINFKGEISINGKEIYLNG